MNHAQHTESGFSLVQVSMLLLVGGIILASMLPGGKTGDNAQKAAITMQRMNAIDEAMNAFMASNLRRPCPADGSYRINGTITEFDAPSNNFGLEAANPGNCLGGVPTASFSDINNPAHVVDTATLGPYQVDAWGSGTAGLKAGALMAGASIAAGTRIERIVDANTFVMDTLATGGGNPSDSVTYTSVVAGTVPTKTLGLPDEYGFDGYGRRIMYVVDNRATGVQSCHDMQQQSRIGNINILGASTDTFAADRTSWALVSYGSDGHGAFPLQGGSLRFNTYSTNADQAMNAFALTTYTGGDFDMSFSGSLVKRLPYSGFDDTVWYSEPTKNTCCVGKRCHMGFSINTETVGVPAPYYPLSRYLRGDVNGDGIDDMVISLQMDGKVAVLFGKKTGWPVSVSPTAPTPILTANLDGYTGFKIVNNSAIGSYGITLAVADVNGDSYDDIIVGGDKLTVFFGHSGTFAANYNTGDLDGATGMLIQYPAGGLGYPGHIDTGDINGDGFKDIVFSERTQQNIMWVVYGRNAAGWATVGAGTPHTWDIFDICSTDGFKIVTSVAYPMAKFSESISIGNFNGDFNGAAPYDDILINAVAAPDTTTAAYLLFGRINASWDADIGGAVCVGGVSPATLDMAASQIGNAAKSIRFTGNALDEAGFNVKLIDINNDNLADVLTTSYSKIYGYIGRAGGWAATESLPASNTFMIDTLTNRPLWMAHGPPTIATNDFPVLNTAGDFNGDGLAELFLTLKDSNHCGNAVAGMTYALYQPTGGWSGNYALFKASANSCDGSEVNMNATRFNGTSPQPAWAPTLLDIDHDGKTDLVFGGEWMRLFVVYGRRHVPFSLVEDIGNYR